MFKDAMAFVMSVVLGLAVLFGLTYLSWASYNYFAPKYRATDAAVFKQSEQYNDGMIRDLENLQMEYIKADDTQKLALKSIILHRFEVYDQNRLPADLWNFYQQVREGKI